MHEWVAGDQFDVRARRVPWTHAEAQTWFDHYYPTQGDVANDDDLIACEDLPRPQWRGSHAVRESLAIEVACSLERLSALAPFCPTDERGALGAHRPLPTGRMQW